MAVGASGVSGLFWKTPVTNGNVAAWSEPGVLQDGGVAPLGNNAIINIWNYLDATQKADVSSWGRATNVTAAINTAIAALPTTGGALLFPPGLYVTSGGHALTVACAIYGFGKSVLSANAPTVGVTQIECGVDGVDVFTFSTTGSVKELAIVDTIVATRTGGDAVVAFSTDVNQRVDCQDCLIYGFWNGYNGRVTNSCHITNNDIESSLNYGVIVDNEANADGGDSIVADNNIYPGVAGRTATGAIRVRNGGNKIIGNAIVKNGGNVTYGIRADIRTGTGQLIIIGNKIESVLAEPVKITYQTSGAPIVFNFVDITGNVFSTSGSSCSAIDVDSIGTFTIGNNILAPGSSVALNINNSAAGTILPNTNTTTGDNYNAGALANGTISYWDANPLVIGERFTNNGVRLTAGAGGGLSVATALSNTAIDLTAGDFFVQGSNVGRPVGTDLSFTTGYNSRTSGNWLAFNSNGTNYGVFGTSSGGDGWYLAATPTGLSTGALANTALNWTQNGNVVMGSSAIATNATNGFFYVDTCAGTPTGTPTAYTGRAAVVYDSSNNVLYVYNSSAAAWKAH